MTTNQLVQMAVLENQAFSLMGRLHVTMRRHMNRVTDIEYMRVSPDYCRHLLELALKSDNEDLRNIGVKLRDVYFGENGLFVIAPPKPPLIDRRKNAAAPAQNTTPSSANPAPIKTRVAPEESHSLDRGIESNRAYVGSLR
ncbi:MAG: hypothetical protein ACXU7H_01840 [Burkholderiaceae bacterium]